MDMSKTILASIVGVILLIGVAVAPTFNNANAADKQLLQQCDAKNLKCEFNTEFKKVNGGVNLKQTFDFSGLAVAPPSGNTGTVDQEARDRITVLENENVNLKNANGVQDDMIAKLQANVTASTNQVATLTGQVTQLAEQVNAAITDVNSNETVPTVPPVVVEPPVANETVPPVANETVPPVANETTPPVANETQPPVSNETIPIPPVANETLPPVSNETAPPVGNETVPTPPIANETLPPISNETTTTNSTQTNTTTTETNSTSTGNGTEQPTQLPANYMNDLSKTLGFS